MRATIDGDSFSVSATRVEGLAFRLLRYLQSYSPADRGQQVLIHVDQEELFEGFEMEKLPEPDSEQTLKAMTLLAETVNDLYFDNIEGLVPFDPKYNISLPDPKEIRLELVRIGLWVSNQGLVDSKLVFQILTRRWVGPIAIDDDYINSICVLPV